MTRKQFMGSVVGLLGLATLGAACTKGDGDDGSGGSGGGGGGGGGAGEGPDASVAQTPSDAGAIATPDAPATTMACTTAAASIGSNHGHVLAVSQADVAAGVQKSYDIQGSAGHSHTVVLTTAMFTTLKANRTLQTTSTSSSSHVHSITVTC